MNASEVIAKAIQFAARKRDQAEQSRAHAESKANGVGAGIAIVVRDEWEELLGILSAGEER